MHESTKHMVGLLREIADSMVEDKEGSLPTAGFMALSYDSFMKAVMNNLESVMCAEDLFDEALVIMKAAIDGIRDDKNATMN